MPLSQKNKIAFVIPWFGKDVPGGAENATKSLIENLKPYFEIEVLTTCIKDFHSDWNENFWKERAYDELDITIRRFKVRKRDTDSFNEINAKLTAGYKVDKEEEKIFIEECVRSENLNEYISLHKDDYKWLIFIPYMFGTTYDGILAAPEKSLLIPCLHDESYAYMDIYGQMFVRVQKVLFLTNTEKLLAEKIFPREKGKFYVTGLGIDTKIQTKSGAFKRKYNLDKYVLCAGRKDLTKNTPELIDFFDRYQREINSELKLVLIGFGKVDLGINSHIIDLGFVSKEDQYNAMTDAFLLCNPSHNESFSIVVMESWLCSTPVLVSGDCQVTKDHAVLSNGGLFYDNYSDFAECLNYFQKHAQETIEMGNNGKEYVSKYFNWDIVTQNYLNVLNG